MTAMPTSLLDPEFFARLGSIVVIDLLLAGDNALVIALAVRSLPRRQQLLGRVFGTMGAVVLRVVLIAIATVLLKIPYMQLVGGLALVGIAVKLACQASGDGDDVHVRSGSSLSQAIGIIIFADLVMSLDNVLGVAAAAHGDLRLVVFGIALSVPIVVWGSGVLARLMARFSWVVWVGSGILGYVAGEMFFADPAVTRWTNGTPAIAYVLSAVMGLVVVAVAWWKDRLRRTEVQQAISR
jgi:YjbE family integral membrane protein